MQKLDFAITELEDLEAPDWDWGHFYAGVGIGLGIAAIAVT